MKNGDVHYPSPGTTSQPSAGPDELPGIRHLVAVGSGKGGVGKSTVSVNLALALQQIGRRIGLVDADVFGPSIPGMLGLRTGQPLALEATPDKKVIPVDRHGLKAISMGMLRADDTPAILRGPMVGKYLTFFMSAVQWGRLDYLVVDLPPGTGDIQLTLAQSFPWFGIGQAWTRRSPDPPCLCRGWRSPGDLRDGVREVGHGCRPGLLRVWVQ